MPRRVEKVSSAFITKAAKDLGISQEEMAVKAGRSKSYLYAAKKTGKVGKDFAAAVSGLLAQHAMESGQLIPRELSPDRVIPVEQGQRRQYVRAVIPGGAGERVTAFLAGLGATQIDVGAEE